MHIFCSIAAPPSQHNYNSFCSPFLNLRTQQKTQSPSYIRIHRAYFCRDVSIWSSYQKNIPSSSHHKLCCICSHQKRWYIFLWWQKSFCVVVFKKIVFYSLLCKLYTCNFKQLSAIANILHTRASIIAKKRFSIFSKTATVLKVGYHRSL